MSGTRIAPPVFSQPPVAAEPPRSAPPAAPLLPISVQEVLGFDPRLLAALPLGSTLLCRLRGEARQFIVTTSAAVYAAVRAGSGMPLFFEPLLVASPRGIRPAGELEALVLAAEHDRACPQVLEQWCEHKRKDAGWRLTSAVALGGLRDRLPPQGWALERVLRGYGAELVSVTVDDEVPAC
jgi:hypothetical protein